MGKTRLKDLVKIYALKKKFSMKVVTNSQYLNIVA